MFELCCRRDISVHSHSCKAAVSSSQDPLLKVAGEGWVFLYYEVNFKKTVVWEKMDTVSGGGLQVR